MKPILEVFNNYRKQGRLVYKAKDIENISKFPKIIHDYNTLSNEDGLQLLTVSF